MSQKTKSMHEFQMELKQAGRQNSSKHICIHMHMTVESSHIYWRQSKGKVKVKLVFIDYRSNVTKVCTRKRAVQEQNIDLCKVVKVKDSESTQCVVLCILWWRPPKITAREGSGNVFSISCMPTLPPPRTGVQWQSIFFGSANGNGHLSVDSWNGNK